MVIFAIYFLFSLYPRRFKRGVFRSFTIYPENADNHVDMRPESDRCVPATLSSRLARCVYEIWEPVDELSVVRFPFFGAGGSGFRWYQGRSLIGEFKIVGLSYTYFYRRHAIRIEEVLFSLEKYLQLTKFESVNPGANLRTNLDIIERRATRMPYINIDKRAQLLDNVDLNTVYVSQLYAEYCATSSVGRNMKLLKEQNPLV
jgi:hypothetical protein